MSMLAVPTRSPVCTTERATPPDARELKRLAAIARLGHNSDLAQLARDCRQWAVAINLGLHAKTDPRVEARP